MSARSRHLPRRSCLSVPGSSDRMLAKAPSVPADMVFIDLEDSVAPVEKEGARARAVDAVKNQHWGVRVLGVRVNGWETRWTHRDVVEVVGRAGERLDVVLLPKVTCAEHVAALDLVVAQVEAEAGLPPGHVGIEAQVETAQGLLDVERICAASPRLEALVLGPADLAASLQMPALTGGVQVPEYPGDHLHYAFWKLLVAARAHGLQVIDGPYLRFRDQEGLRDYCQRPRALGYDGKWAVHPEQVTILNDAFSPTPEQFERALAVLDAHRAATEEEGRGAAAFRDEMIDEASRKMATALVARGERAGLDGSSR